MECRGCYILGSYVGAGLSELEEKWVETRKVLGEGRGVLLFSCFEVWWDFFRIFIQTWVRQYLGKFVAHRWKLWLFINEFWLQSKEFWVMTDPFLGIYQFTCFCLLIPFLQRDSYTFSVKDGAEINTQNNSLIFM